MAINSIFLILLNAIATLAVKKSSLTFVIDDTGSMNTEIENVRSGSKSIVDVILTSGSSQIEDLVLVTFNDPDVKFRVRTRDRKQFKQHLDDIIVYGGGDCDEMSMTGLERGLNESRQGSFIFLFTDVGPKDASEERIERIKSLCQEKEAHVVFVVTPNKMCLTTSNFSSYYDIAQSSAGQVLRLEHKFEVGQIMPYINNTVTGDRTLITSKVFPRLQWTDIPFEIDDQTQYAVASTSGNRVVFRLLDENNATTEEFEPLVWIDSVKVAKINKPGRYVARVISNSTASIVIFARTDFTFEPGFAVTQVKSFEKTKKQPYEGIQTHLWISVDEPKHLIDINSTEILDMNESLIQTIPLTKVYEDVYVTELFLPPNSMFKVAVNGIVRKTGNNIKRFAKLPVEPKKSKLGLPKIITDGGDIHAVVGDRVIRIPCVAIGDPMPSIKWFVNGKIIEKDDKYSVENGTLVIKKILKDSIDTYKCHAENSHGIDEQNHTVNIDSTVDNNDAGIKYVLKSTNDTLECSLATSKTDSVRWFKNGYFHSEGLLKFLLDASTMDDGNYTCRVDNDFGSENGKTIEVLVDAPPTRRRDVQPLTIVEWKGGKGEINCKVDTYKTNVKIEWFHNGLLLEGKNNMDLTYSTWGNYTCKVSNYFGTVANNIQVTSKDCLIDMTSVSTKNIPLILNELSELPNFITNQHHMIIPQGTTLKLFCNGFKEFSDKKEIKASCLKEDQYVVNNKHYKFSDFYCNAKMVALTEESEATCAGKNTKIVKIGFNTGKFVEVLKSCFDTDKNVPIFTKTIIPNYKYKMYHDNEISDQTYIYGEYGNNASNTERPSQNPDCKYVKGFLTSVEDISFGVAQRAILEKEDFNGMFYLSCNNNSNWKHIEGSIRRYISGNRDDPGFIVWSGTSKYERKNKALVPRFLWKVIKTIDSEKSLAIVTVNSPQYTEKDRLCGEEDLCNESWISEVADWPTYCCQVSDFSKAFNISDDNFLLRSLLN